MNENEQKNQEEKKGNAVFAFFKQPPVWFVWLVFILTLLFSASAITLVAISYTGVIAYILYALAGVFLAYFIYLAVRFAPTFIKNAANLLRKNNFFKTALGNEQVTSLVFAVISVVVNTGFIVFYSVCAILYGAPWYGGLAGYYFLLGLLRGGVALGEYRAKKRTNGKEIEYVTAQLKNYRLCGVLLFVLEIAMTTLVGIMLFSKNPTTYTEVIAITMAAYTFYKITIAIINVIKARKRNDYYVQTMKNIGLVEAAMSLFSLQILLISTFSGGEELFLLNVIVGAAVCLFALGMGVTMIALANIRLKRLQTQNNENTIIEEIEKDHEQNG